MTIHSLFAPVAVFTLLVCNSLPLMAQVEYGDGDPWNQRAESGPGAEMPGWFANLRITGRRTQLVAYEPKALLVGYVLPKKPARGLVKVDDKIIGAGEKWFKSEHRNGYGMDSFVTDGPVVAFCFTMPKKSMIITGRGDPAAL